MNPRLDLLQPYPFEKLARLKAGIVPPADKPHIALSIGEPQDPPPHFLAEAVIAHLHGLAKYPTTRGLPQLREAIAAWLQRRFRLAAVDPERQVLPVNGTREALFSFAQALIDPADKPLVLMPNPFYQIYEGAALLAGAEPYYLNATAATGFLPDFDAVPEAVWRRCRLLYLCSPYNPTGRVIGLETLKGLIEKAQRYDFVIAGDECYSELHDGNPPPGLLQAAAELGLDDYRRCVVFHSLSKRSSAPGLRSGFVAGDAAILERYFLYRTYHGCAMPLPAQHASIAAWNDEAHVARNRAAYRERFAAAAEILAGAAEVQVPPAAFYFWLRVPGDDAEFARRIYARENVTVLPGSFLAREAGGVNPGRGYVRIAWVHPLAVCVEAAQRISRFLAAS
ncbi:N-succinyldiaminopimelate aminotransferase [Methylomarinovum tepidoasis]|uniref:N-succinyldiaminopimelate aminotransferase n=1 Tax=Methylomarinovum tepidoasis TaxID=2840183 RepID=A0AAU9CPY1_9GAMM|nr:succinyldiaminopimelate transaminase [Methylomarinovum sp. IN45]BCX89722.1 N-succinyldiaminopimelate aminotransferase [Methylomarinovum sp. IN45]